MAPYYYSLLIIALLFSTGCHSTNTPTGSMKELNKTKDISSSGNKVVFACPIVKKVFVKKNGQPTDRYDYYLQRSVQDYFIKFCESEVSREELENHLKSQEGPIKTVRVEVEFKTGAWDDCDDQEVEVQSRIGKYAVLFQIIS